MTTVARCSALGTSDVPAAFCSALTRSGLKASLYRTDPYFRHGAFLVDVRDVLATTFVVAKPDAVAGRRIEPILEFLTCNAFYVTSAVVFTFTPLLTREVWRYQFNIASRARSEVVDLLLPAGYSLLLVLRDATHRAGSLPAACRLAKLKGAANPRIRDGGNLRALLNGPSTLFNFVHTADEPADVVREFALLELATGNPILATLAGVDPFPRPELSRLITSLYDACPAHDLDAQASWRRLAVVPDPGTRDLAQRALAGDPGADWSALLDLFPGRRPPRHLLWDVLAIATSQIECDVPGLRPVLPTVGAYAWEDGATGI